MAESAHRTYRVGGQSGLPSPRLDRQAQRGIIREDFQRLVSEGVQTLGMETLRGSVQMTTVEPAERVFIRVLVEGY